MKRKTLYIILCAVCVLILTAAGMIAAKHMRKHRIDVAADQMFGWLVHGDAESLWRVMADGQKRAYLAQYNSQEEALRHIHDTGKTYDGIVGHKIVWTVVVGKEATVTFQIEHPGAIGTIKSHFFMKLIETNGKWLMKDARSE
jgi:hypothetical protein